MHIVVTLPRGRAMTRRGIRRGDVVSYILDYEVDAVHGDGMLDLSRYNANGKREEIQVPITALDKPVFKGR